MALFLRRIAALGLSVALIGGLAACGGDMAEPVMPRPDVLTQKITAQGKTQVTVLVKHAFSIHTFEAAAEAAFPNLDLVQVGNYTSNMGTAEYNARLEHGDLTDLVMTWPLEVGEQYWDDRLLDLSGLPLTGKYINSMLANVSRDGKLYYLPGPAQVRGIVYNKTMFEENGWEVPRNFDGFAALCKEIEASGIRALQLGLGNSEVLDTAFVGYGFESSFSAPKNRQALADYNSGKGSFGDNFTPALETFQTLIDEGILKPGDLDVTYVDREMMLFTRKCAMVEDSVLLARMGFGRTGSMDEFALMPFFNPGGDDSDWARLYPVCYIGVDKRLAEPANEEKYNLVMELLEYISTPEGQVALMGDTGAMFSNLNGVPPPDIPEIADLLPALTNGRYAIFPTLQNAQSALRQGLGQMVAGTMTAEQVIALVDQQNQDPPIPVPPLILGEAAEDFTLLETGSFLTDAMRAQSGCEIALFLDNGKDGVSNAKGVSGRLYQGDLTSLDIGRVLPDQRGELWKITMTGEDLLRTLEYSIPVDNNQGGWFYYFSGLNMEYAPAAQPGIRIRSITDGEGKAIEPQRLYSVAVMNETVPEKYIRSCEKTGILISAVLENAIGGDPIVPSKDGRFTISEP